MPRLRLIRPGICGLERDPNAGYNQALARLFKGKMSGLPGRFGLNGINNIFFERTPDKIVS